MYHIVLFSIVANLGQNSSRSRSIAYHIIWNIYQHLIKVKDNQNISCSENYPDRETVHVIHLCITLFKT